MNDDPVLVRATAAREDVVLGAVLLVMLLAVAAVQWLAVESTSLSRWKGGAFGMFSTVDSPRNRVLRTYLIGRGPQGPIEIPVEIPDSAANQEVVIKARSAPSASTLRAVAVRLIADDWVETSFWAAGIDQSLTDSACLPDVPPPSFPIVVPASDRRLDASAAGQKPFAVEGARVEAHRIVWDWHRMRVDTELIEHLLLEKGELEPP